MNNIVISVQKNQDDVQKKLADLTQKAANSILSRAINKTLKSANTEVDKQLRSMYNISKADLNSKDIKKVKPSFPNTLTGTIWASPWPLSMSLFVKDFNTNHGFKATMSKYKRGGKDKEGNRMYNKTEKMGPVTQRQQTVFNKSMGVLVEIKKGERERMGSAFLLMKQGAKAAPVMGRGKYGGAHTFQWGKKRKPIGKLSTLSLFYAITSESMQKVINKKISEGYKDSVIHEIKAVVEHGVGA